MRHQSSHVVRPGTLQRPVQLGSEISPSDFDSHIAQPDLKVICISSHLFNGFYLLAPISQRQTEMNISAETLIQINTMSV